MTVNIRNWSVCRVWWSTIEESVYQLLRKKEKIVIPQRTTFLCNGFKWGPEHSERTYQVHNLSSDMHEVQLPFILNPVTRHYQNLPSTWAGIMRFSALIKKSRYSSMKKISLAILLLQKRRYRKTVLQRLLSSSMLHLGHIVLVVDPKTTISGKG